jgi:mannose-1-phosphate guanylyltransferase
MKGLLLIGGIASRLYPLSRYVAKSLLPICDRELLHYQVAQLARAGIGEIILAAGHHVEQIEAFTKQYSGGLGFHTCLETEPLGTAGAIANAWEYIEDEPVVVLNADILSSLDIGALLERHQRSGSVATVVGYAVPDPSRYGLLRKEGERLLGFDEKPRDDPGPGPHFINAGVYVLEPEAVRAIPLGRRISIERETFPQLIESRGHLGFYELQGFWADIGTFESYFAASFALLAQRYSVGETALWGERDDAAVFKDLIYINKSARLGPGVDLYHRVIVMADCSVGGGCRLRNTIVMPGASIGDGARLQDCIVGPGAGIGEGEQFEHAVIVQGEPPVAFYPEAR